MLVEIIIIVCFILYLLATMSPLGWYPPHVVDNTDIQYLGGWHWQQCWFFRFLFVVIYLCMCQSVCMSERLFTINLKFLKTHNCWLAQLVYVSLVAGLEFKKCKLDIKMLRNSFKKSVEGVSVRVWVKTACFFSMAVNNYIRNVC